MRNNHKQMSNAHSKDASPLENQAMKREEIIEKVLKYVDGRAICHKDQSGRPYVTWDDGQSFESMEATSTALYYQVKNTAGPALGVRLSKSILGEIIEEIVAKALHGSAVRRTVNHRIARSKNGTIMIDLCNANREVIAVDANGFRVHDYNAGGPLFVRSNGMMPLPNPIGEVGNIDLLCDLVNLPEEQQWKLLIVFLLYCLRPNGPYTVLVVSGVAGSSKSSFCKLIRQLIDPSSVPTQALPRKLMDLMITASNSFLLVFDNVRTISLDVSDGICRMATGAGSRTRSLFTNTEETLIHVARPCILNGIGDLVDQPDLVSRCIQLNLQPVAKRRTEEDLAEAFPKVHARIFAGLLDALSRTLANLPSIKTVPKVRMADFARFGLAVERAMNWPTGSFMEAYDANQREQMSASLADDPLANTIKRMVECLEDGERFTETPTSVLTQLGEIATRADIENREWPETPHSLSKRLKKMQPALHAFGVGVDFRHSGGPFHHLYPLADVPQLNVTTLRRSGITPERLSRVQSIG